MGYGTQSGVPQGSVSNNVGIGYNAMNTNAGNNSIGIGIRALQSNANAGSGDNNLAIGYLAGSALYSGSNNTLIGGYSGAYTMNNIVAISDGVGTSRYYSNGNGAVSFYGISSFGTSGQVLTSTGSGGAPVWNTLPSASSTTLGEIYGITQSSSPGNVSVGYQTLNSITSGTGDTCVGYQAGSSLTSGSNCLILGNNAQSSSATVSNEITLGNSSISVLRCQVTTITSLSDQRDKKEIKDLPIGLEFVENLRPVEFTWNARDKSKIDIKDTGFIAQELQMVEKNVGYKIPNLVYDENPDKLETGISTLIPVLVQSIKELSNRVKNLEKIFNLFENKN